MQLLFTKDFEKNIRKITDKKLAALVQETVLNVSAATDISEIRNIKKLTGYSNAYRIRVRDHRIGVYIAGNTVEFACFLNRKEIYRFFP